jgi:uncharacterized protein YkwD
MTDRPRIVRSYLTLLSVLLAGATPSPSTGPGIDRLRRAVVSAYGRFGEPAPAWDPALAAAAQRVAMDRPQGLDAPDVLQLRVQEQGRGDPAPIAFLVTGPAEEAVAQAVATKLPRPTDPANAFGVGLALAPGGLFRAVVLRSHRKAFVEPPPRQVDVDEPVRLSGRLDPALRAPSLYVEDPNGQVISLPVQGSAEAFHAQVELRAAGSYTLEVMAASARGPEVAWLYRIQVGRIAPVEPQHDERRELPPEPHQAAIAVFDAINRERLRVGAPSLAYDPHLAEVARGYSEELRDLHLLAHVSPRSGDLKARLRRANYAYARAGENLAQGRDPLEAHAIAVGSPAHKQNMLDSSFDRCGVGVAETVGSAGEVQVIVTELFAGG